MQKTKRNAKTIVKAAPATSTPASEVMPVTEPLEVVSAAVSVTTEINTDANPVTTAEANPAPSVEQPTAETTEPKAKTGKKSAAPKAASPKATTPKTATREVSANEVKTKGKKKTLAVVAKEAKTEKPVVRKAKMIRDSFTFPESDYALIAQLKQRAIGLGQEIKKSELLRAGLVALSAMPDQDLLVSLGQVERVKMGRPSK